MPLLNPWDILRCQQSLRFTVGRDCEGCLPPATCISLSSTLKQAREEEASWSVPTRVFHLLGPRSMVSSAIGSHINAYWVTKNNISSLYFGGTPLTNNLREASHTHNSVDNPTLRSTNWSQWITNFFLKET